MVATRGVFRRTRFSGLFRCQQESISSGWSFNRSRVCSRTSQNSCGRSSVTLTQSAVMPLGVDLAFGHCMACRHQLGRPPRCFDVA